VIDLDAIRERVERREAARSEQSGDYLRRDGRRIVSCEYDHGAAETDIAALLSEVERLTTWISVEDRLPTDDDECIVVINGEITTCWYFPLGSGHWTTSEGCGLDQRNPRERVTHWRPLPEFSAAACGKPEEPAENV